MGRRSLLIAAALGMLVSACGTGAGDASTVSPESESAPMQESSTTPQSVDVPATQTGQTAAGDTSTEPETPVSDRPAAPGFTLALGDGEEFVLSEEAMPVYMVFWAEW